MLNSGTPPKLGLVDPGRMPVDPRFNEAITMNHAYLMMQNYGVAIELL